ncbi:MAG: HAMP domain-containing histidine kinase [Bacteroides sp.]|nr:HAMP domain-containing histidine kinase [Bacteroides sp.]
MNLLRKISYRILPCLVVLFCHLLPAFPEAGDSHPVLLISSYNPDARQTSGNISDFMEEFQRLGGRNTIALENMNCKSFSESPLWTQKMKDLLAKYQGSKSPALIVLIGQEAWAAYLSLEECVRGNTPTLTALASRNAILLPDSTVDLKTWMPASVDFFTDFPNSPVKAGFVYEYDVVGNVNLIKTLYPKTKNIAFVSDNSYGGVSMQAYVVEEMKKFPDLNLILLDGRVNTIYTISDKLHELPENTALLMGTWRVDMNDGYFMRNATYAMMEAAPTLPTFSLSSVGLGYWAVGGIVPAYRPLGKEMARQAFHLLLEPEGEEKMEVIPNEIILDGKLVKEKKLDISGIPEPVKLLNITPSFYEQYKYQIWSVFAFLLVLLIGLFVSLYFYYHTKKLKDELEVSEGALREAKERAEESSRLKSAFLANMSHEIRTPLNAIVGFSDVLSSGDTSIEEQRGFFEIIKTNSDLLLRLINDILDVSRLEADRVTFSLEKCDVVQVCQQVVASVAQARRSGNQFLFECDRQMYEMKIDVQRLQQVVINLLSNADKFTKEGTITLKLDIDEAKKVAVFSVSDTGCGIPLDKQKQVFERFEKLNEYVQGTGLGLSICKLTVEKWGGDIWIDPSYTDGARFMFTHPLNLDIDKK